MRVIGGHYRSRVLRSLPGLETRPTPDKLRQALFDVLAPRIEGAVFLDAYAGTGAVGIEALSRGAARAIFIERGKAAVQIIGQNLASLGLKCDVAYGKVTSLLPRYTADIVFLDPPYERVAEYKASLDILGAAPPSLVIAQHSARLNLELEYGGLVQIRVLKQGDNSLTFFEARVSGEAALGEG